MINSDFRQALRAHAHHLNAVILIGQHGLTPAIIAEIDRALNAHGLIKIKWRDSDKETRVAALDTLCQTLTAEPIAHIGKHLVIWREQPEPTPKVKTASEKPAKKPVKNAVAKRRCALACAPKKRHYRMAPGERKNTDRF